MKDKKSSKKVTVVLLVIVIALLGFAASILSFHAGKERGYKDGYNESKYDLMEKQGATGWIYYLINGREVATNINNYICDNWKYTDCTRVYTGNNDE